MIFGDYHVHSKFSKDGKSTIEENVQVALKKGLKQIASTEHAFCHPYGIKKKHLKLIREEINQVNQKYPVRVLFGLEANLISSKGEIDVPLDVQNQLDMLVLGFHKGCRLLSKKPFISFFNHFSLFGTSKKRVEKNTQAYINAIKNNNVNILAHLNCGCKVNVAEVGKVAKENNVYIELNGKQNRLTRDEIKTLVDLKCMFIVDSDAHSADRVADCHRGMNIIEKNNIPTELVANINKLPVFVKRISKLKESGE